MIRVWESYHKYRDANHGDIKQNSRKHELLTVEKQKRMNVWKVMHVWKIVNQIDNLNKVTIKRQNGHLLGVCQHEKF